MPNGIPRGTCCDVCGGGRFRFLYHGIDRFYHLEGRFDLYQCIDCSLIFIYPFLERGALAAYYPENYYSYVNPEESCGKGAGSGKFTRVLTNPLKAANALIYSRLLGQNRDVPSDAGSTVLDIGCGDGRYLLQKRRNGSRCYGVDISEGALQRLRKKDPGSKRIAEMYGMRDFRTLILILSTFAMSSSMLRMLTGFWRRSDAS